MPEMDGLETVKAIREKLDVDVPIIIVSAYDYSEIEDELFAGRGRCVYHKASL